MAMAALRREGEAAHPSPLTSSYCRRQILSHRIKAGISTEKLLNFVSLVHTCEDGSRYVGEFKWGVKHGLGHYHFSFANGPCYEGAWHEGRRQGLGIYTFKNGETQSGHWQNGVLDVPSTQNTASYPVSPVAVYHSRVLNVVQVTHPLCDRNMILARLDAAAEIAECIRSGTAKSNANGFNGEDNDTEAAQFELSSLLSSVLTTLARSVDLQRGITRIFYRTATVPEFFSVMESILFAGKILQKLHFKEENSNDKLQSTPIRSLFLRKIVLSASSPSLIATAAKLLSTLNKEAAEQGDISNLIITSNNQYPEVGRAQKAVQLAKDECDALTVLYRKQLGVHSLEFLSVSGSTHLIELLVDKTVPLEWVEVNSTKKKIRYHPPEVLTSLDRLALANEELLVACRAAWDNFLQGFTKYYGEFQAFVQALSSLDCVHSLAVLSRNKPIQLHISCGRHPILETILQDNFVPNDSNLHADGEICQIVNGPNMGGKSCYIRQVAIIAIMAQMSSFVPASSATLHVLDGIYTSVGAYHVSYLTSDSTSNHGDITYLYKLRPGVSERSFGFKVAELAQVPLSCVSRAAVMASKLEAAIRNRARDRLMGAAEGSNCPSRVVEEELVTGFKQIFSILKSALEGSDLESILPHARNLA